MKRTTSLKSRKPMRRISKARAPEYAKYAKLKAETLPGKFCEFPGCFLPAVQVHHIRGRRGKMLNDKRYWALFCSHCHRWVEDHKNMARSLGLIKY